MPFPEFEPGKKKILFLCAGAVARPCDSSMAIVDYLLQMRDDLDVRLVSYATGALAIRKQGRSSLTYRFRRTDRS